MKKLRWCLLGTLVVSALAQSQSVYNYFPPTGITYTPTGGMALGSATGGAEGAGTLNAQGLYINGVAVSTGTGTVTSVSVASANGLSGTVATPTTTPAITLAPTFTGIAYSNGSALSAAVAANFPTLNQNTTGNAATATTASTASALATTPTLCASGQVAQGILANGNATGCITPFSVVNESANTLFAGPTSGTAALPTFRALVGADLPLSAALTWTGNTTWTGDNTMSPTSGVALAIDGAASSDALDVTNGASQFTKIIGSSTTGSSSGLDVVAGTNSSDTSFQVTNRSGSATFFKVRGDGATTLSGSVTGTIGSSSVTWASATTGGANAIVTIGDNTQLSSAVHLVDDAGGANVTINGNEAASITTGSFTITLTGCTTTTTATASYVITGSHVDLHIPSINCTSNSTTHNLTGLPNAIQPKANIEPPLGEVISTASSPVRTISEYLIQSSGNEIIMCYGLSGSNCPLFPASGTIGTEGAELSYGLQ